MKKTKLAWAGLLLAAFFFVGPMQAAPSRCPDVKRIRQRNAARAAFFAYLDGVEAKAAYKDANKRRQEELEFLASLPPPRPPAPAPFTSPTITLCRRAGADQPQDALGVTGR